MYLRDEDEWCFGSIIVEPSTHIEEFQWHYLGANGALTKSPETALFISMVQKRGYNKSFGTRTWSAQSNPMPLYVTRLIRAVLKKLVELNHPVPFNVSRQTQVFLLADDDGAAGYWEKEHGFTSFATVHVKHGAKMSFMKAVVGDMISRANR
jgi:hypothetical protein